MARIPLTEEQKQKLRDNLARGRATAAANRAAGIAPARQSKTPPQAPQPQPADINALVERMLAERLPSMMATLAQANGDAPAGVSLETMTRTLAMEFAKFTGQGVGKTYIAPEELEKRDQARKAMFALLDALQQKGEVPSYRLVQKTQLVVGGMGAFIVQPLFRGADRIQHDTLIDYPYEPNFSMVPDNEPAKRVFALFERANGAEMPQGTNGSAPLARGAPLGPEAALTPSGVVVRGAAAAAIKKQDERRGFDFGADQIIGPMSPHQAAAIRRGDDPQVRFKQVYGTLTDPIEMR